MWLDALMAHIYQSLHQMKMRETMLTESQSTALMCRYSELHTVYNRKTPHNYYVLYLILSTVKIICDAAHVITNVEAKWPGSVHDSRIYRESTLSNRLQSGK